MRKQCLSVIVPCYNEEEVLSAFYREICRVSEQLAGDLEMEYLFIDDGSRDRTLSMLKELAAADSRVHYISFSRNFGKEAGIYAGLKNSVGDYAVVMDADLQHPPEYLPEMYRSLASGEFDCVAMRRVDRTGEGKIRSFFSRCFYRLNKKISGIDIVQGATDYRMMTRQVVDAVLSMSEYNRFTKGIFAWVGFRTKWIGYHNVQRTAGTSKWSFGSLLRYSLDGITAFSTVPLAVSSLLGFLFCILAFLMMLVVFVKTLVWGDPVAGYPTLITVILLIGGLQLLMIGILGQYFSKAYLEIKHRPIYIAKEQHLAEPEERKKNENPSDC